MMDYGKGMGAPTVTPSTVQIPGQNPIPPWAMTGALKPPQTVSVTGVLPIATLDGMPGPSYVQPPGPLAQTQRQMGF